VFHAAVGAPARNRLRSWPIAPLIHRQLFDAGSKAPACFPRHGRGGMNKTPGHKGRTATATWGWWRHGFLSRSYFRPGEFLQVFAFEQRRWLLFLGRSRPFNGKAEGLFRDSNPFAGWAWAWSRPTSEALLPRGGAPNPIFCRFPPQVLAGEGWFFPRSPRSFFVGGAGSVRAGRGISTPLGAGSIFPAQLHGPRFFHLPTKRRQATFSL